MIKSALVSLFLCSSATLGAVYTTRNDGSNWCLEIDANANGNNINCRRIYARECEVGEELQDFTYDNGQVFSNTIRGATIQNSGRYRQGSCGDPTNDNNPRGGCISKHNQGAQGLVLANCKGGSFDAQAFELNDDGNLILEGECLSMRSTAQGGGFRRVELVDCDDAGNSFITWTIGDPDAAEMGAGDMTGDTEGDMGGDGDLLEELGGLLEELGANATAESGAGNFTEALADLETELSDAIDELNEALDDLGDLFENVTEEILDEAVSTTEEIFDEAVSAMEEDDVALTEKAGGERTLRGN